jgi:signal transduction histidine kinase
MQLHGVSVEVSDLKRAEERAREATEAREELLAIVSHDLRAPLSVIVATAGSLRRSLFRLAGSSVERERARLPIERILRSSERMDRLIADLLDLSKLSAGKLQLDRRAVSVDDLVSDMLEMNRPLAEPKGIALEVSSVPRAEVFCDRERVLQVLSNLVGNAIKFTPEGGRVRLRTEIQDGDLVCAVSDTGPGISKEEEAHIFERFWRGEPDGRASAGLGLSIAKAFVEAHGGRIWLDSVLGRGTTFYFSLPLASAPAERPKEAQPPSQDQQSRDQEDPQLRR